MNESNFFSELVQDFVKYEVVDNYIWYYGWDLVFIDGYFAKVFKNNHQNKSLIEMCKELVLDQGSNDYENEDSIHKLLEISLFLNDIAENFINSGILTQPVIKKFAHPFGYYNNIWSYLLYHQRDRSAIENLNRLQEHEETTLKPDFFSFAKYIQTIIDENDPFDIFLSGSYFEFSYNFFLKYRCPYFIAFYCCMRPEEINGYIWSALNIAILIIDIEMMDVFYKSFLFEDYPLEILILRVGRFYLFDANYEEHPTLNKKPDSLLDWILLRGTRSDIEKLLQMTHSNIRAAELCKNTLVTKFGLKF